MKAIVYERYGPPEVLHLKEVPKPRPKDDEVLIRIHATTVTTGDWRARSLEMPPGFGPFARPVFGFRKPRQPILGTELAGRIDAVGRAVTRFKAGDAVFAFPGRRLGCYAEYRCMPEHGAVAPKPDTLTYEQAAALSFGGATALSFLKRGGLQRGERVLVNGASGSVGTAVVQLAKHFGAHVTGVCSGANVPLVTSLGADCALDYTRDDFTQSGERYDVIVDTAGTAPYARSTKSLAAGGRLLLVLGGLTDLLTAPWISLRGRHKVIAGPASENPADVRWLGELASRGQFRPVIDRQYPFEQIVDAHRYVDQGHKRGNVVITLNTSEETSEPPSASHVRAPVPLESAIMSADAQSQFDIAMAVKVTDVPNVRQAVPFFNVKDIEASLRFYVDGLGFTMTRSWDLEGRIRWCWLELGHASIMLQAYWKDGRPGGWPDGRLGQGVSVCFMCADAIAVYRAARSRGLEASTPFVGNSLWVTSLTDPDGYRLDFESPTDVPEETTYSDRG